MRTIITNIACIILFLSATSIPLSGQTDTNLNAGQFRGPEYVDGLTTRTFRIETVIAPYGGTGNYTYRWMIRRNYLDLNGWELLSESRTLPAVTTFEVEDIYQTYYRLVVDDGVSSTYSPVVRVINKDIILPGEIEPDTLYLGEIGSGTIKSSVLMRANWALGDPIDYWWQYNDGLGWVNVVYSKTWDLNVTLTSFKRRYRRAIKYITRSKTFYTNEVVVTDFPEGPPEPEIPLDNVYSFTYDGLNRLTDTRYYKDGVLSDEYTERNISYDHNGNIRTLQRYSQGQLVNDLAYEYEGNQLTTLSNSGTSVPGTYSYTYDANGNMIRDGRQGVELKYNHLNLVSEVYSHDRVALDFPNSTYKQDNVWSPNSSRYNTRTFVSEAANGFSGGYERYDAIEGGTEQISIYNRFLHILAGPDVWVTVEYRSNVELRDYYSKEVLLASNPAEARTAVFRFSTGAATLEGVTTSPDSWMEIRTLKIEEVGPQDGTPRARYMWLADGTKLSVASGDGNDGYEYLGSMVYKRVNGELVLESAAFGGGRIIASEESSGTVYTPNYFLTDHLGSTRVVVDNTGNVVSRHDYFPFGLSWSNPMMQTGTNRYLYNGKELQQMASLDFLDYGARMYDGYSGRWFNVDPLAEEYLWMSPYVYTSNNPIKFIDLFGLAEYEVNPIGHFTRIKDGREDIDIVHKVDREGNRIAGGSIEFEANSLQLSKGYYSFNNAATDIYGNYSFEHTTVTVAGDGEGQRLFEFLGGGETTVEWAWFQTSPSESGPNILFTSHLRGNTNPVLSGSVKHIREMTHNHPGNNNKPSDKDMAAAEFMMQKYPGIKLSIYTQKHGYSYYNHTGVMVYRQPLLNNSTTMRQPINPR